MSGERRGGAPAGQQAGWDGLPGRRTMTAWFAAFTVYAGAEIFTRHADGTWGAWACGGYALATIALLVTRTWLFPLAAAVLGAFVAPLAWLILKVPDTSTAEVVVINRSADYLVRHGTPYLPAGMITDWQHYNPYLPLMELFGLPRKAGLPLLLGDPRVWTSLVTVAALAAAFAIVAPRPVSRPAVARLTAIAVASPLVAFPLTVGVTDPPIIALTCLALALAARRRFLRAALVLAVACAMKSTAWAVVPVLAVLIWSRESLRAAARFTGAVSGAAVLLALAAAPNVLATPDAIRQNLIDYPLGTSTYKTVAASPLPGHLISQLGRAGHLAVDALLLLAVIAFACWLLLRPPRDMRDATVRLIVLYATLFTLAPSSRYGYYAYPLALLGWLALTRGTARTEAAERVPDSPPRPADSPGVPALLPAPPPRPSPAAPLPQPRPPGPGGTAGRVAPARHRPSPLPQPWRPAPGGATGGRARRHRRQAAPARHPPHPGRNHGRQGQAAPSAGTGGTAGRAAPGPLTSQEALVPAGSSPSRHRT